MEMQVDLARNRWQEVKGGADANGVPAGNPGTTNTGGGGGGGGR